MEIKTRKGRLFIEVKNIWRGCTLKDFSIYFDFGWIVVSKYINFWFVLFNFDFTIMYIKNGKEGEIK